MVSLALGLTTRIKGQSDLSCFLDLSATWNSELVPSEALNAHWRKQSAPAAHWAHPEAFNSSMWCLDHPTKSALIRVSKSSQVVVRFPSGFLVRAPSMMKTHERLILSLSGNLILYRLSLTTFSEKQRLPSQPANPLMFPRHEGPEEQGRKEAHVHMTS